MSTILQGWPEGGRRSDRSARASEDAARFEGGGLTLDADVSTLAEGRALHRERLGRAGVRLGHPKSPRHGGR